MSSVPSVGLLLLRLAVGVVFTAHGWNHIFGGGKIAGTARWFDSLGMRPGLLHAWTASLMELGAGALLVLGLLTPLGGAGVVGVMLVAWVTNHRKNVCFALGIGGAAGLLVTFWRPPTTASTAASTAPKAAPAAAPEPAAVVLDE